MAPEGAGGGGQLGSLNVQGINSTHILCYMILITSICLPYLLLPSATLLQKAEKRLGIV